MKIRSEGLPQSLFASLVSNVALIPLVCMVAGCTSGPILIGDGLHDAPVVPAVGGGPSPFEGQSGVDDEEEPGGICHPSPGELGAPDEVPEGFSEPDHSDISPAHPPHLRTPDLPGHPLGREDRL